MQSNQNLLYSLALCPRNYISKILLNKIFGKLRSTLAKKRKKWLLCFLLTWLLVIAAFNDIGVGTNGKHLLYWTINDIENVCINLVGQI